MTRFCNRAIILESRWKTPTHSIRGKDEKRILVAGRGRVRLGVPIVTATEHVAKALRKRSDILLRSALIRIFGDGIAGCLFALIYILKKTHLPPTKRTPPYIHVFKMSSTLFESIS